MLEKYKGLFRVSKYIRGLNNALVAPRKDAGDERIDGSRRVDTICIFVPRGTFIFVSKYHGAPRSVFDAIRAKEYLCDRRHSSENCGIE